MADQAPEPEPGPAEVLVGTLARPDGYDPGDPLAMLGLGPQPQPCVVFECVGVAGAFEARKQPDKHAKIVVEPWRE